MSSDIIQKKINSLQSTKQKKSFWNITYEQGVFLSNLIAIKKPKTILEIGTSNGFSTLWISKHLDENTSIDTIEINEERQNIAKQNIKECNLTNINFHLGNAFDIIQKLKSNKYDFLFIDAAQAQYKKLITQIEKLDILNKNFTIVFDNVTSHKHLSEFNNYINENYTCQKVNLGGGFLICKEKK